MKAMGVNISCILLILILGACKDIFYPDDIISNERIPVIQGIIIEGENPQVKLSWATNYEENSIEYISDAVVWITDDLGNDEDLVEFTSGLYAPVNINYKGIIGRTYTLHVELPDGNAYESTPERINSVPELDSLYAVPVEKTVLELNSTGSLIEKEKKGLDVKVSLSKKADSISYFRFETDILTQITYTLNPNSMLPTDVYEWKSSVLDNVFDVEYSYTIGSEQVVPEHTGGFLEFIYNSMLASDESTAPYTDGWVASMHVFSVSASVYNYYNSIAQQLNANNQIFAPVPSQIKGNMHCVNNAVENVIGVFEASSEIIFYKAFSWVNNESYRSKDLIYFPSGLGDGLTLNIPPGFWVDF